MAYTDDIAQALAEGDAPRALALLEDNEAHFGQTADFLAARAMVCLALGEEEAARNCLAEGVVRFPEDAEMMLNFAYVLQLQGNVRAAREYYQKAARLARDPALRDQASQWLTQLFFDELPDKTHMELTVKTPGDLDAMSYARGIDSWEDIGFLLRRVEFGHEVKKSIELLRRAVGTGRTTRQALEEYVLSSEVHWQKMIKVVRERM